MVDDGTGIADALAERLRETGRDVVVSAEADGRPCAALLDLSGLQPVPDRKTAEALVRRAFGRAQAAASVLAPGGTYGVVFDGGGGLGLHPTADEHAPWRAALGGLAKCLAHEWPATRVKSIDIATGRRPPAAIAARLAAELLHGGPQVEVALSANGVRHAARLVAAPLPADAEPLPLDGLLVVSGGARGTTARCLLALLRRTPCPVLLLGRTAQAYEPPFLESCADRDEVRAALTAAAQESGSPPAPAAVERAVDAVMASREVSATLAAIKAIGVPARYASVDIRNPAAVAAAVAGARAAFGPVQGIIHGASLPAGGLLVNSTAADFDAVFDTRARGLTALLDATASDPLRLIALIHSAAARKGNRGHGSDGMAGEVLNRLAWTEARRRGPACRVVSVGWTAWDEKAGPGLFAAEALAGGERAVEVVYDEGMTYQLPSI